MHAMKPRTMTSCARIFALVVATRYVVDQHVAGHVVECGVSDRELHLLDTFEGMPPPTTEDRRMKGAPASELLASRARTENIWAIAGLDDVRAGMA